MSLGLPIEDIEMLNAAQDVIEKFTSSLPDPIMPVSFCSYECSYDCSVACASDCMGACSGTCNAGCYGSGN